VSRYYRPELDALRFLAFVCVFCFHRMDYVPTDAIHNPWLFNFSTAGAFGVPVFFLLSAFLITALLLREYTASSRIHIKAFYVRRILRIWPLYFFAFYGLVLLAHFLPDVGPRTPSSWLAFSLFVGNWYILRHGWIAGPVDPLWSISVEEQFYIVIPLFVAFGGKRVLKITSVLLLAIAYVVILRYALHPSPGDNGEWTNSFVHSQFFAAGTLIALLLRGRLPQLRLPIRLSGIALALSCWLIAVLTFGVKSWDAHPTPTGALAGWLLVLAGCIILFLSLFGVSEKFIPRWLAYLGRISYGLYVYHSLILHLVFTQGSKVLTSLTGLLHLPSSLRPALGTTIVLVATILVAHFSYQFFERPFIRLKKHFTFVPARED
jgi:peptidoglycan/LPS O-acetylase OafA/YrhL